jgi:hypothetical protein
VIGTGTGALPVVAEVKREAQRRKIKLLILPTADAIEELKQRPDKRKRNSAHHVLMRFRRVRSVQILTSTSSPVMRTG